MVKSRETHQGVTDRNPPPDGTTQDYKSAGSQEETKGDEAMKLKVEVTTYRHAHYLAVCSKCAFESDTHSTNIPAAKVRAEVRKHVIETGHTVSIDKSIVSRYELVEDI